MKLFHFEGTRSLMTEGYVIAPDMEAAREDAEDLCDVGASDIWEDEWGVRVSLRETAPEKLPKGAYVWNGGASGSDVSVEEAQRILSELQEGERLPECEGQLTIEVIT